jgi:predicted nucleic acid-binding protein
MQKRSRPTMDIYIDSDVIVASEIINEDNHDQSKKFMDFVLNNQNTDIAFYTSVFTFVELASAMTRRTNNDDRAYSLLYRIRNSWKKSIKPLPPIPVTRRASFTSLVESLIETSIKYRTLSADTIHAQTIAGYRMNYLVTWNVSHFLCMEKDIKTLRVVTPTGMLECLGNL